MNVNAVYVSNLNYLLTGCVLANICDKHGYSRGLRHFLAWRYPLRLFQSGADGWSYVLRNTHWKVRVDIFHSESYFVRAISWESTLSPLLFRFSMNCFAPIVRRDVLMNVSLLFDIHFEHQIYVDDLVAVTEYIHDFSVIVQNSKRRFPSEMMQTCRDFCPL